MGLESASFVSGLNSGFPEGGDQQSQGDDHLRLIKTVLKGTFPDASKAFYFPKVSAEKTSAFSVSMPTDDNTLFPVNATSAAVTVTLGSGGVAGQKVTFIKTDSSVNIVTLDGTIVGGEDIILRHQGATAQLIWDHTNTRWNALVTDRLSHVPSYFALTSNTTLTILHDNGVVSANATSAGFTITLPSTNIPTGYRVRIIKTDSSTNIIVVGSVSLYHQNEWVEVVWNGSSFVYSFGLASSNADVWAGNVDRGLRASDLLNASALQSLTYDSPTMAISWTGGFVREASLSGNTELGTPSGGIPGQFRTLIIKGSDSTSRELTFSSGFGGVHPTIDDITSSKWYAITIMCVTASHFIIVGLADASPPS